MIGGDHEHCIRTALDESPLFYWSARGSGTITVGSSVGCKNVVRIDTGAAHTLVVNPGLTIEELVKRLKQCTQLPKINLTGYLVR
jgi:hypothetical protein